MNNDDKSNVIPLVDVTAAAAANAQAEDFHAVFAESVAQALSKGPAPVLFARLDQDFSLDVHCVADESQVLSMVMALVTMIGANKIGDQGMNSFPDQALAQTTAQVTGLSILNALVNQQVRGAEPRTPATDAEGS